MKQKRFLRTIVAVLLGMSVFLNVAAWLSIDFSDFYTDRIFPVITRPFAELTSRAGFSVGEILLIVFVLILISYLIYVLLRLFLGLRSLGGKKDVSGNFESLL